MCRPRQEAAICPISRRTTTAGLVTSGGARDSTLRGMQRGWRHIQPHGGEQGPARWRAGGPEISYDGIGGAVLDPLTCTVYPLAKRAGAADCWTGLPAAAGAGCDALPPPVRRRAPSPPLPRPPQGKR